MLESLHDGEVAWVADVDYGHAVLDSHISIVPFNSDRPTLLETLSVLQGTHKAEVARVGDVDGQEPVVVMAGHIGNVPFNGDAPGLVELLTVFQESCDAQVLRVGNVEHHQSVLAVSRHVGVIPDDHQVLGTIEV